MHKNFKRGTEQISTPGAFCWVLPLYDSPRGYVPQLSNNLITAAAAKNEDYSKNNNPGAVIIKKMA